MINNILDKINSLIAQIEKIILIVFLSFMVLGSFAQIILRNFFDAGLPSVDIVIRHMILWICFVGASLATYHRQHIKIDIINRIVQGKTKKWFVFLADIFCVVVCIILAKAGYTFVVDEFSYGGNLVGNVPRWIFMVVIPVWLYVMSFRFFVRAIKDLKD